MDGSGTPHTCNISFSTIAVDSAITLIEINYE